MSKLPIWLGLMFLVSACGSVEKETTIVHERPIVVQSRSGGPTPADVQVNCVNGYDNHTSSCY